MAQYPQGIFQTIQWLLRKVKVLALGKIPVYSLSSWTGTYTFPGRGIYGSGTTSGTYTFPNPALFQGQTIIVSLGASAISLVNNGYQPKDSGGTLLTSLTANFTYEFTSVGSAWVGGAFQ